MADKELHSEDIRYVLEEYEDESDNSINSSDENYTPGDRSALQFGLLEIRNLARPRRRLTELLLQAAATPSPSTADKTFHLQFLRSPVQLVGDTRVSAVRLAVNTLHGDSLDSQRAVATGSHEELACGLVLRSIGYRSVMADPDLPFDQRRSVITQTTGVYAAGWVSTGPVGVILSTMSNAFATGATVCQDMASGAVDTSVCKPGAEHIMALLRQKGVPTVDFSGWERINKVEVERGQRVGKPQEKIVDVAEMLEIGGSVR